MDIRLTVLDVAIFAVYILAVMALAQAVFTWFFVPETKNRPLEEIEECWKACGGLAGSVVTLHGEQRK